MSTAISLRLALAFVICLAALAAFFTCGPVAKAPASDGPFYTALARSLADGHGYRLSRSPWPDSPNIGRLPLLPILMTPGMAMFRNADEYTVMHYTAILIHCVTAVELCLLAYYLWSSGMAALLAGVIYAVYPPALSLVQTGYPEPAFAVAMIGGLLLIVRGRLWTQVLGSIVAGAAVLARSNFVILPLALIAAAVLLKVDIHKFWKRFILLSGAFLLLPFLWMVRNYIVSGDSLMLSAVEGETLYGSNNPVVASTRKHWGSWIMPDEIPGELPKLQLASRTNEIALNRYYHDKAIQYFRENWRTYPKLIVGKIIRAFLPILWLRNVVFYVVFVCRELLYLAFAWYAVKGILKGKIFRAYILGMFFVVLVTAVIFYGSGRLTFPLEVVLIPCVAAGLARDLESPSRPVYANSAAG